MGNTMGFLVFGLHWEVIFFPTKALIRLLLPTHMLTNTNIKMICIAIKAAVTEFSVAMRPPLSLFSETQKTL